MIGRRVETSDTEPNRHVNRARGGPVCNANRCAIGGTVSDGSRSAVTVA
ncbi:hypothetical protein FOPG_18249 [Fusarium oxysporum f. sp. conglutinans race 2 54008]|uniref:Uncharacterized protein n=2 Tax=Fusarium oxysporum TaxID=5507 RepID=X0GPH6_FUSOX|nr:hypothetical protein FOZG_18293 [Fusarium oxysporum Fo47]EXL65522.1 hypothetical protein FOPG_18249 [Fusarium oxysporum f. sp. conglutinans race 2 54008]